MVAEHEDMGGYVVRGRFGNSEQRGAWDAAIRWYV